MTWILMLVIGGFIGGVSDIKITNMSREQCLSILVELKPGASSIGAVCIAPGGEVFGYDDLEFLGREDVK